VELDPEYALAHAGIADCYSILGVYGYGSLKEMGPRALSAVRKAMELEPSLGEVHYSMGNVMSIFGGKCTEALPHLQRALEIQPRASYYHAYRSLWLAPTAPADEVAAQAAKAVELDPLSPFIHGLTALALSSANQPREAVRNAARALELHPNFVIGLWSLHAAKRLLGELQQSIEVGERLVSVSRRAAIFVGQLGLTYGLAGQKDKALPLRQELEVRRESGEFIAPVGFLAIDAGLDDEPAVQVSLESYIQDGGHAFADALMMPDLFSRIDRYPSCGESMKKIRWYLSA
jgi:tetratricopeptide (TPR) repeat protein